MLLVIDVGNTNMEFGVFNSKELVNSFRMGTNREVTSDEIGLMLTQFLSINGLSADNITDVVVASVVPQVMYSLSNAIKKYVKKTPLNVGENLQVGVPNLYENPAQVGADRLVNAKAAFRKYGGPLIIVDFGTATTFDAVDKTGAYLGGAIFPGIKISMEALFQKASKLPRVELVNPGVNIGRNTEKSMQVGAVYGYLGVVRGISSQMLKDLGPDTKIIATGGLSALFANFPGVFDTIDRTLTLDGLKMIYDEMLAKSFSK